MRSMFHCHADAAGSNASSSSSANAIKNWIAKNGLPPVFSCTSSANGRARSGVANRLQRASKRVRRTDLVVPVGADQQQVVHLRVRDQMLEEVERCRIQPLQIIEEQRERVLLACEHAEEAPEH